jgi:PPOX class probable F420-dependent enzyme
MPLPQSMAALLARSRNLILAGNRAGGRPHLTPNWFYWDGERFYVSTTRDRVKYAVFRRDPRAQLLIDDPAGPSAALIPATVEIREDLAAELPRFRAIRDKYGMKPLDDDGHLRSLIAEGRVLLAITPDGPPSTWTSWGLAAVAARDRAPDESPGSGEDRSLT